MGRVAVTKRYNVAQYEHEEYSIEIEIDEKEEAVDALVELKGMIQKAYETDAATASSEEEEKPRRGRKPKASKDEGDIDEEDEEESDEEEIDEEADAEEEGEEDEENDEEEVVENPKRGGKKAAAKTTTTAKKSRSKPTMYDRTDETHKKLFTEALTSYFPSWKKSEATKKKAKQISIKLDGTSFLDNEGSFTDEFIGNLRKGMGSKK